MVCGWTLRNVVLVSFLSSFALAQNNFHNLSASGFRSLRGGSAIQGRRDAQVRTSTTGCSEVSRRVDDKDRFKCIFLAAQDRETGVLSCPSEKTVDHDGDRYLCEPPARRNSNETECKAWCRNVPSIDGCIDVIRGEWWRQNEVKCIFPVGARGVCEHKKLAHGGKDFACTMPARRNSNREQCKAWCSDNGDLDLVPSVSVTDWACSPALSHVPQITCEVAFKSAQCLAGPAGSFLCFAEAVMAWVGETTFWRWVGETVASSVVEKALVAMGLCPSRAATIASGISPGANWGSVICGQMISCACNKADGGSCFGDCVDYAEDITVPGCTQVSRYSDGFFKPFQKDQFKCVFPALWNNATGVLTCPAEKVVDQGGDRYPCERPKPRNSEPEVCKTWCQNKPSIDGCVKVSRGEGARKGKVKCTFPADASGGCGEHKTLKHGNDSFPCEPSKPSRRRRMQCKAWCEDHNELDLVPDTTITTTLI